jgi:hypothetical protein
MKSGVSLRMPTLVVGIETMNVSTGLGGEDPGRTERTDPIVDMKDTP